MLLFHKDMCGLKVKVGDSIVEVDKDGFVEIKDEKAIKCFLNTGFSVSKGKRKEKVISKSKEVEKPKEEEIELKEEVEEKVEKEVSKPKKKKFGRK